MQNRGNKAGKEGDDLGDDDEKVCEGKKDGYGNECRFHANFGVGLDGWMLLGR